MEGAPDWLAGLPIDRAYVTAAALFAAATAALRVLLESHPRGRTLRRAGHALEGGFLALLLAAMIVFSFLQIVLRNVANTSLIWIDPFLRHLVLWVGFLGAMLATRAGRHINVDALSRFLPAPTQRVTRTFTNLLAAFVCLLLSNAGLKLVRDEATFGGRGFLDLPTWTLQIVMPIALVWMASRFLGHALDAARGRAAPASAEGAAEGSAEGSAEGASEVGT